MQQVELKGDDEATFLHPLELEEEVRRGRVPSTAEVRYAPWTGESFARVDSIPALAQALGAPAARASARLASHYFPWLSALLLLLLILAFILQFVLGRMGLELLRWGAVGFEPTLLEGAWWSTSSAPWLHANSLHLLFNLPVVAYCCSRVEQVLGASGLLLVLLGSCLGAALLIVPFAALPVVGSSVFAFGAWGAQLGLGLRLQEAIPPHLRGAYGWRSYFLFALFLVLGFSAPAVSVLSHVGAYLGGLAASLLVRPETLAPRSRLAFTRLRVLGTGLGLLALPAALAGLLSFSPALLCPLSRRAGLPDEGLELSVCWRMANHPGSLLGLDAWQVGPDSDSAVFAAAHLLRQPDQLDPELLLLDWERRLGGSVSWAEAPALAQGWRAWTYTRSERTVWEQARVEGARIYRVGWYSQRSLPAPRRAFYEAVLRTARVSEPASLRSRREAWAKLERSPQRTFEYAEALEEVGRYEEALALLARLEPREDGWEWESTRARFRICSSHPGLPDCAGDWRAHWLKKAMQEDLEIHMPAIRWWVAEGRCPEAREQALRLKGMPEVDPEEVHQALGSCEVPR